LLDSEFVNKLLAAFKEIDEEIDKGGGEFDYRYSFADHILKDVLGWTRKMGEGHFRVEKERKDIVCFDDGTPPFPVIIIETKRPSETLTLSHIEQLENYLKELGSAKYGILTNGRKLVLYGYSLKREMYKISEFNIDEIVEKESYEFSKDELKGILELKRLTRDRYVKLGDVEYFKNYYQETPLRYHKGLEGLGYDLFISSLKQSLEELTDVLMGLFDAYYKREDYSGDFLRRSFADWESWRAFSGTTGESKKIFCRETAYILLNRILFARICEDKGISTPKISGKGLAGFLGRHESIKNPYLEALEDAYRSVERHYSHFYQLGIFDWWKLDKEKKFLLKSDEKEEQEKLENDLNYAIGNTLKRLNRFNFKIVDRDILGHVYEDYLPKEERKRLGEFYTPIEVVKYILDAVGYTPRKEIRGKCILDPACGSGTFLVEAVNRLIERYHKKLGKDVPELSPEESRTILENIREHIYGLDINPFACHIAEINFLFHIIDLYNNVKRKYPDYVLERFNIYCTDSLRLLGTKETTQMSLEDLTKINGRAKSFVQEKDEADKVKTMKFDFVVGNPPYVRVQRLSKEQKDYYNKNYQTPQANYDIYLLFIERGTKWVKENGELSYICSNQFMLTNYGQKLRKYLLTNFSITQIIDFRDSGVFKDATNYPCIFVAKRVDNTKKTSKNLIKCIRVRKPIENILEDVSRHVANEKYSCAYYDVFEYPQTILDESIWILSPKSEKGILNKIHKATEVCLGDVAKNIFVGTQTSKDEVYYVYVVRELKNNLVKIKPQKVEEEYVIERDILKPLLKGENIHKWQINWGKIWLVFPYKKEDKTSLLTEEELRSNYPYAWDYFLKHRDVLEGREGGRMVGKKDWYGYIYPKNHDKLEQTKIISGFLSTKNKFAFDQTGHFYTTAAGGDSITLKEGYDSFKDCLFFLGLLNSKVLEFCLKHISPVHSGGFYLYSRQYLEQLPIKLSKTKKEKKNTKEITQKVDKILDLMKQVNEIEGRLSDFPDSYVREDQKASTLVNIMEDQKLSKDVYRISSLKIEPIKDLEGKTLYKLFLTKKDYIAFDDEGSAEFLRLMLEKKEKVAKTDLLRLSVPSKEDMSKRMKEYHKDIDRIKDIKNSVSDLEKEIDDAVYELYGLKKSDKEVVESFLEKF